MPPPALAQDNTFYVGLGAGAYQEGEYCDGLRSAIGQGQDVGNGQRVTVNAVTNCDDTAIAGRLYFGWQMHENIAIEGGYTHTTDLSYSMDATATDGTSESTDNVTIDFYYSAFDLSLLGSFSPTDNLELYGRGGVAFWEYSNEELLDFGVEINSPYIEPDPEFSEDGTDLIYGIGANYYFKHDNTGKAGINLDWTHIAGDVKSNLFLLNIIAKFH